MSLVIKMSGLLSSDRCSVLWPGGSDTGHLKINLLQSVFYLLFVVMGFCWVMYFKKILLG